MDSTPSYAFLCDYCLCLFFVGALVRGDQKRDHTGSWLRECAVWS